MPFEGNQAPPLPQVVVTLPVKPGVQLVVHTAPPTAPLHLGGKAVLFAGGWGNVPLQTVAGRQAGRQSCRPQQYGFLNGASRQHAHGDVHNAYYIV